MLPGYSYAPDVLSRSSQGDFSSQREGKPNNPTVLCLALRQFFCVYVSSCNNHILHALGLGGGCFDVLDREFQFFMQRWRRLQELECLCLQMRFGGLDLYRSRCCSTKDYLPLTDSAPHSILLGGFDPLINAIKYA